jgi:hypothetical protein
MAIFHFPENHSCYLPGPWENGRPNLASYPASVVILPHGQARRFCLKMGISPHRGISPYYGKFPHLLKTWQIGRKRGKAEKCLFF